MTLVADITEHSAPAEPVVPDPRIAVAETWLCMLGALMAAAKRFSRFLIHEAMPYRPTPKAPFLALRFSGDPMAALKRVVRAARFAAVLYVKIQKQIAAWKAGVPFDLDAFLAEAPRISARAKSGRDAAAMDQEDGDQDDGDEEDGDEEDWEEEEWEDLEDRENLYESENLVEGERFDVMEGPGRQSQEDKYQALLKGPLKDAIKAICEDLGIKPDWSLWTDNGFPTPAGGEVDDWVVFFAPMAAAAAPLRDPRDAAAYKAWKRRWCPWERHERAPSPYRGATRPPDPGG